MKEEILGAICLFIAAFGLIMLSMFVVTGVEELAYYVTALFVIRP